MSPAGPVLPVLPSDSKTQLKTGIDLPDREELRCNLEDETIHTHIEGHTLEIEIGHCSKYRSE